MWVSEQLGQATWQQAASRVAIDARGGHHEICLTSTGNHHAVVKVEPVDEATLPEAADQFIRGDQWHVSLPQAAGTFSLDLAFRPIVATGACLVMELTMSIHTSLLDSHPMLDLCVDGPQLRMWLSGSDPTSSPIPGGCAAVTLTQPDGGGVDPVAVLLGPSDRAFTTDRSSLDQLRLRLFGDFLEKGVIRKARPWVVLGPCSDDQLAELWKELRATPLPLAT